MRDKYLYMKSKNNKPLRCILVGNEYKFYYCDYADSLANKKVIQPKNHLIDKSVQTILIFDNISFKGLYLMINMFHVMNLPFASIVVH